MSVDKSEKNGYNNAGSITGTKGERRALKANRKYIVSLLLLFLLMGLTFYLLFHHFEFAEIWGIIQSASGGPLAVAVMMVPVYLLCYGGVMQLFLRSFGYRTGLLRCTGYGCIDFYYSAITPSSTGGQPMVIYHMEKDGVPMSKAVLAPLVHTVLYKVVLILFTVAGLVCCPGLVWQGGGGVFAALLVFGAVINALMLAACLLSMFRPRITKRIGGALIRLLGRLRLVKDPEKKTVDFAMSLAEYQEAAAHVKAHKTLLAKCFLLVLVQRVAFFLVPYFIYLSLGFVEMGLNPFYFIAVQAVIAMAVDSLPLPGGMGANELAMIMMYNNLFGSELAASAMLMTRGVSYYLCLVISSVCAIGKYAAVVMRRRYAEKTGRM